MGFFGWVRDKIRDAVDWVKDKLFSSTSSESSYDRHEASISTTERLNEILISFLEGYNQYADQIEVQCIKIVEDYYKSLIKKLKDNPENKRFKAKIKRLEQEKSRIRDDIKGTIRKELGKRMSLDDSECLAILKMDAGSQKKERMKTFSNKIIKNALGTLAKNVRQTIDVQAEEVMDVMMEIQEERENAVTNMKRQYDKMVENCQKKENSSEQMCMKPLLTLQTAEYIENLI